MNFQHVENLLIRFRGERIAIKTMSGGIYEGTVMDVTNDYVAVKAQTAEEDAHQLIILLHSIESISPQSRT